MSDAKELIDSTSAVSGDQELFTQYPDGYEKGKTKYIVITGSVISGVGKGTFSSCLGTMLQLHHGFNTVPLKFECYVNYDSGTLNPFRHGEVFVLDDGTETDLDLGTYERMLNKKLDNKSFVTMGKVFKTIIDKERQGFYLGRDVEFIPHVTGQIKYFARKLAKESQSDIVLIEIGGTVGEIQNSLYLEAMRELAYEEGKENVCFVNVTYVLDLGSLGEQKSKAAQLGIRTLMSAGIQPNIIICRSEKPISNKIKEKISIASNVPISRTIGFHNTNNIYKFPLELKEKELDKAIFEILKLNQGQPVAELDQWKNFEHKVRNTDKIIKIGITGKYTKVFDSYISIIKALEHTTPLFGARAEIVWIDTTEIENGNIRVEDALRDIDGIIVPGGFGKRGAEGKIQCIKYIRENKIPYLGLCYGFQMALIEFARNVCGISDANSTEINPNTNSPVIIYLPEQLKIEGLGGNMRLGGRNIEIKPGTKAFEMYGNKTLVRERFRHRWECNPDYIKIFEEKGIIFSGKAPDQPIMQILELNNHPFFVGTQAHPEFTSRPLDPNPFYREFVRAVVKKKEIK